VHYYYSRNCIITTLCISTVLTDITHATTGATGIGLQDYQQELPQHLLRIPLQLVVHQLYREHSTTIPLTGGCGAVNATGTITVTPNNTASAASTTPLSVLY
jgi:hypothetical protein